MMFSPERLASMASTNWESFELCSSTVSFSPATGVPVNAPHNGSQMLSIWLVATSSLLMASAVRASQAGASCGSPLRPRNCILYFRSATTLPVSN